MMDVVTFPRGPKPVLRDAVKKPLITERLPFRPLDDHARLVSLHRAITSGFNKKDAWVDEVVSEPLERLLKRFDLSNFWKGRRDNRFSYEHKYDYAVAFHPCFSISEALIEPGPVFDVYGQKAIDLAEMQAESLPEPARNALMASLVRAKFNIGAPLLFTMSALAQMNLIEDFDYVIGHSRNTLLRIITGNTLFFAEDVTIFDLLEFMSDYKVYNVVFSEVKYKEADAYGLRLTALTCLFPAALNMLVKSIESDRTLLQEKAQDALSQAYESIFRSA